MNFNFEDAWKAEETKPVQPKVLPVQQPQPKNPMMNNTIPKPPEPMPVQPKVEPKVEPKQDPQKKKATFNNLFGI